MDNFTFRGSLVALVTPFDARGRIDVKALQSLVRWHVEEGTDGIVCAGTTGEAPALSETDRKKILQACLEAAEKRMQVIAGTGTCDTKQTIRLTQMAQRIGADGCLVVTPYYNKPSQKGCLLHFQAVSCVGLPFIIYNNPGRTVIQLQPETIAEISLLPHASALKESTNDPTFLRKVRVLTSLPILAGEDALTLDMIQEGACGAISVIGNLIPKEWKELIRFARQGEWEKARECNARWMNLIQKMSPETNPLGIKAALGLVGKCRSGVRLPLTEPSESFRSELTCALREAHLG